jgi:hypothetical protein
MNECPLKFCGAKKKMFSEIGNTLRKIFKEK